MTIIFSQITIFIAVSLGLSASASGQIKMWERASGLHSWKQTEKRDHLQTYKFTSVTNQKIFDFQYGRQFEYQGVDLMEMIHAFPRWKKNDLILMHFSNEMIVPLPTKSLKSLKVFIANGIKLPKKNFSKSFPKLSRDHPTLKDPLPIEFRGNKVVVTSGDHPYLERPVGSKLFSPWRYVDSLVGLEFVSEQAYYDQFPAQSTDALRKGFEVFKRRCQYCHGLEDMGARFGWDFKGPIPMDEKRSPASMLHHIKIPKAYQFQTGRQMPVQEDVNKFEVAAIWNWIRSLKLKKNKVRRYSP